MMVLIRDANESIRTAGALIDCGATSTCITPGLVGTLGFRNQALPAHMAVWGLHWAILACAEDSRKLSLTLQYLQDTTAVDEPDILVVEMKAYELVLGLPWFQRHGPEVGWLKAPILCINWLSKCGRWPIDFGRKLGPCR